MNISEIITENNHTLEIILSGLYTKTIEEDSGMCKTKSDIVDFCIICFIIFI